MRGGSQMVRGQEQARRNVPPLQRATVTNGPRSIVTFGGTFAAPCAAPA